MKFLVLILHSILCPLLAVSVTGQNQEGEVNATYKIPRVAGIAIDGSTSDWTDQGFRVEVMADIEGRFKNPQDFDPQIRLGWSEQGLLVLAEVQDDMFVESDIDRRLFLADSVEFFVGTSREKHDYFMLLVAPGQDPEHPQPRHIFFDERDGGPEAARSLPKLQGEVSVGATENGYVVELLIPWSNLSIVPRVGRTLSFQAYAMDRDGNGRNSETFRVAWFPAFDTHENETSSMMTLKLAESPSRPVAAVVRGRYRDLEIIADRTHVGGEIRVEQEGEPVAQATLRLKDGRAAGSLRLPKPVLGEAIRRLDVYLNAQLLESIERGGAVTMLGAAIKAGELTFYQNVFNGPVFPKVEFQKQKLVESLIGDYKIATRFYDSNFREVTSAQAPGRYGAVVTVRLVSSADATSTTNAAQSGLRSGSRFFTLFCVPEDRAVITRQVPSWSMPNLDVIELPGGLVLAASEVKLDESEAMRLAANFTGSALIETGAGAGAGAGTGAGVEAGEMDEIALIDQAWWVKFKRVYYGLTGKGTPLPLPRPVPPAERGRELREGTPEEAGLHPRVVEHLEDFCDRWAIQNRGQGFTICVARNGVAFFHRAYGQSSGKTVTLDTPARIKSATKPVTGTLVMVFADRGLIDLDAPIGEYLPLLGSIEVPVPFTLRQLLTHSSGLNGHFGDEQRDLEERIANEYSQLVIPVPHLYSGRGFALAIDALELMTGEVFPVIYNKVLFEPMGMTNTRMLDSHSACYTTAWDLAKLSQLVLNKGTYGGYRYFSPETLEQGKPMPMVKILGDETKKIWGIGFEGERGEGEGATDGTAFGHSSSNSSIFRVDPATDLLITIASLEDKRYVSKDRLQEIIGAIEGEIVEYDGKADFLD